VESGNFADPQGATKHRVPIPWPTNRKKTKARLPRGFTDTQREDIRAVEKMMATIRDVYELYGFEPADQPLIEYTDALGKFLPDQDRPNEGVFSFQDDDDPVAVAALRPDRADGALRRREF